MSIHTLRESLFDKLGFKINQLLSVIRSFLLVIFSFSGDHFYDVDRMRNPLNDVNEVGFIVLVKLYQFLFFIAPLSEVIDFHLNRFFKLLVLFSNHIDFQITQIFIFKRF